MHVRVCMHAHSGTRQRCKAPVPWVHARCPGHSVSPAGSCHPGREGRDGHLPGPQLLPSRLGSVPPHSPGWAAESKDLWSPASGEARALSGLQGPAGFGFLMPTLTDPLQPPGRVPLPLLPHAGLSPTSVLTEPPGAAPHPQLNAWVHRYPQVSA